MSTEASNPFDTLSVVQGIKQKIDSLTEEQSKALQRAIYLGMTPDEAKHYDDRRKKIAALFQELACIEKARLDV